MIKSYLKIAFRSLAKNKTFSFINIFGLAIGITSCMLIAVFVFTELNYDKYPKDAANIYRVGLNATGNADIVSYPLVDIAVGPGIKKTYPEVLDYTRILNKGESFVRYGDKQFKEAGLSFADANFLRLFSIPIIEGDAKQALEQPNSIVVSRAFAKKYFGAEPALGKLLTIGSDIYKVSGVIEKVPDNSHFHFDAFMSMATIHPEAQQQTWSNIGYYTYLLLDKTADPKKLETKFPDLVAKYVVPEIQHDMGVSLAEAQKSVNTFRFFLQPLTSIHLYSNTKYELEANGDIHYVYIFSALALFILLLACVNFTNLSTASSSKRAREVGIRKVMGSIKGQLVSQFLTESVLLTMLALVFACLLVFFLLPYFNQLSGKHISFGFFLSYQSITILIALSLLVGAVAGIYPAFFLSS
jgi:putative ABC transport system permease protein